MSIQINLNLFDIDEITIYRDVLNSIIEKAYEREKNDILVLPAEQSLPADDVPEIQVENTIPYEKIDGENIQCSCGTTYKKIYKNKHIKTKKHCAYLASFTQK